MACNDACEMEFYQVQPGSVRVTSNTVTPDSPGTCPRRGSLSPRQQATLVRKITNKKNDLKKPIGAACPNGCPCDAEPGAFTNRAVQKNWKVTTPGRCKYVIKGTYMVKTQRVKGICNTAGEEDDFGEIQLSAIEEEDGGSLATYLAGIQQAGKTVIIRDEDGQEETLRIFTVKDTECATDDFGEIDLSDGRDDS